MAVPITICIASHGGIVSVFLLNSFQRPRETCTAIAVMTSQYRGPDLQNPVRYTWTASIAETDASPSAMFIVCVVTYTAMIMAAMSRNLTCQSMAFPLNGFMTDPPLWLDLILMAGRPGFRS